ncbi:MAG TPA: hypothetical protein VGH98_15270 [Gemmatimonadaceae bacterium]|jgi:hypothetical protein
MSEHRNYCEFTDSAGVRWKAYRVEPQRVSEALERLRSSLSSDLSERRQAWLLFESPNDRRRLSPVPDGWDENASAIQLEQWCGSADRIPPAPERREDDRRT